MPLWCPLLIGPSKPHVQHSERRQYFSSSDCKSCDQHYKRQQHFSSTDCLFASLTIAGSPPPKLSFAERLAAKIQQEERNQKLFRAVSLNKIDNLKELLELGANPNFLGRRLDAHTDSYPIYVAADKNFNDVLRLLIKYKAKVDVVVPGYGTALYGAIASNNQEGVEVLLEGGADPNKLKSFGILTSTKGWGVR